MRSMTLLVVLVGSSAFAAATTAKIFTDKGSQYMRTDNKKLLSVGAELDAVVDPAGKPVGKAVIMEVNGALARVSLDDDATKAGAKFVVLPKAKTGAAAPATAAPAAAPAAVAEAPRPKLNGTLESGALRVTFANNTDASWTGCELHYADGSTYKVGEVVKHSDDAVMKVKFTSAPEPVYDHVVLTCAEGESKFYFNKPQAPVGKLKGYATNDKGSLAIYNSTDTAWTACDISKPDKTHFVMGTLKGHDSDTINRGNFKKEAEAKAPNWIELRCNEGVLHQKID